MKVIFTKKYLNKDKGTICKVTRQTAFHLFKIKVAKLYDKTEAEKKAEKEAKKK